MNKEEQKILQRKINAALRLQAKRYNFPAAERELRDEIDILFEEIRLDYSCPDPYCERKKVVKAVRYSCEHIKENIVRILTICEELETL